MSNSANNQTTIRVIPCKCTKEELSVWEEKFIARCRGNGYKGIIKGTDNVPISTNFPDISTGLGKAAKKSRNRNDNTYEDLILSIAGKTKEGQVAFGIVKGYKTKDLPDRDACLAWKILCNKYLSKSTSSLLKLKRKFRNSKLRDYVAPEKWITDPEDFQSMVFEIDERILRMWMTMPVMMMTMMMIMMMMMMVVVNVFVDENCSCGFCCIYTRAVRVFKGGAIVKF